MSSKSRAKPAVKKTTAKKTSVASAAVGVAKTGASMLGIGGTSKAKSTGRKKGKKSALWYARAIQKEKLKRKYEKLKFGFTR